MQIHDVWDVFEESSTLPVREIITLSASGPCLAEPEQRIQLLQLWIGVVGQKCDALA